MSVEALIVCAAPEGLAPGRLAEIAPDFDLIIAVDGGAAACLEAGLIPHVALGDMDSVAPPVLHALQATSARLIVHPAEKDVTDLDLALTEARTFGAVAATVTSAWSGRLDHTLAAVGSLLRAAGGLTLRLLDTGSEGWIVGASTPRDSIVIEGDGATFSVIPLTRSATVTIDGARYRVDRCTIDALSSLGVSNIVERRASIAVHEGVVLAMSVTLGDVQHARVVPGGVVGDV